MHGGVRKGGRQKLEKYPPMRIEVGRFDPRLESCVYDALRQKLQRYIALFRAILRFLLSEMKATRGGVRKRWWTRREFLRPFMTCQR